MTDHTVDPQLLSQIEELRQLLSRSLQQHPSLVARCVALTQRLDQVTLHIRQNPSDESTAWRALAEIGAALSEAQRALPSASAAFDLLRETLPSQPRLDAQLLNQAQLVQHLSAQPHTLDAAQGALREYAEQHQRQPQAAAPHPGSLQAALSAQVTRAPDTAAQHESRLVSSRDLGRLQQALSASAPLADLDPNQPHISSSGDLQHDLRALADRYLTASTLPTSTEDLVLARIEADDRGNIRNVHLHAVQALQAARPQAPVRPQTPASPIAEATQSAFHTQAAVDLLRRRLSTMRHDLADDRATTIDAHNAFAAEQRRLQALEALASDAQQRLQTLSSDTQQRAAAEQAIASTRDAATQTLQHQTSHLANTAQSFIQSLQQQAQQATGSDRQALLSLRTNVDQWLQNPALQSPTAESIQQHASALHTLISQSHAAAPAASQPLLHHLAHQAADTSDRAAAIASTLSWSPLANTPPATPSSPATEVDLHTARSLVASHASRFQSAAYASSTGEDRLLAVEQPFASFLRDLPPTSRVALPSLSLNAPATSPAPQQRSLNLSAITAQSAAHLLKLRGLTPNTQQPPSVNVYADTAGPELPRAASAALSTSDAISSSGAEMVDRSMQRALFQLGESTRQAQQLAASVAHLSATRSGQRDLGFASSDGSAPLFKRKIGVSKDGKVGDVFLPALREVSGLSPNGPRLPSDAGERGELAIGQRAEAGAVSDRQTQLLGALERVFQQMLPGAQTTALVGDAVQSAAGAQRALSRFERAASARTQNPQSNAAQQTSRETQELTKALRSEAQSVSHDVISKLGPVLSEVGVDFGSIRLYNGPRAAQLADAMGAHAFAMGKHIFGRMDLSTIQGLSVFAHEATHTTHYDDTTSVTQKEQEAEAVERKAVQHLSRGRYELALEPPTATVKSDGALRASGMRGLLDAAAPNPNDLLSTLSTGGMVSQVVVTRVSEVIMKRMKRELTTDAERTGTRPR